MSNDTGFTVSCNWCDSNVAIVKPIDKEMCVIECKNLECQETVHYLNYDELIKNTFTE